MPASKDDLVRPQEVLDRLIKRFQGHPLGPAFRTVLASVRHELTRDLLSQDERFESYLPQRPADEPHDAQCQVTRLGGKYSCTCKSNGIRRREQVKNAALAGDMAFRETLGSMEAYAFDQHMKEG